MDIENTKPLEKFLYLIQISGIVIVPIIITLFIIAIYKRQYVRDNWLSYRNRPYIMPFASFFAPEGYNVTTISNFRFVTGEIIQNLIKLVLAPIHFILKTISSSIKDINGVLNKMRKFIYNMRTNILNYFSDITMRFNDFLATFQFIMIKLTDTLGKLGAIGRTAQYIMYVLASTLQVIVNVIGDILRTIIYALIAMGILLFLWMPALGALLTILAAGMGIAYCFDPDTLIDMENNNKKKISELQIGDKIKGGIIEGIMVASSNNIEMYDYDGIIVSGQHFVYEQKWIKVKDSSKSKKINYKKNKIYCLITDSNLIFIDNIKFRDLEETKDVNTLNKINRMIMENLNNQKYLFKKEQFDNSGFYKNTLIKMYNGLYKRIKDLQIGDKTSQGEVISIIKSRSKKYLYKIEDEICSGENIIYQENNWNKVFNLGVLYKKKTILYHITTEKGIIETQKNIYRDYNEIKQALVLTDIQNIILENINN